ncbi:MAG: YjjG family noncanonical pyrimidine nucleotidase [Clostridia bacterium]|nr:YjjG family noncanonical pyrimidine nucleotidase [Clostridia bacterium]
MKKIILFDADNTLMDFDECSCLAIKQACADFEICFDNKLFKTYQKINDILWHKIELGELTRPQLYEIRWKMIFEQNAIDKNAIEFEKLFLANLAKQSALIDGAKQILQYLTPKYTLCVASNAPFEQQLQRLQNAGIKQFFSHFFISEKIGHQKPTKEFFDFCFKSLGNPQKSEVMIIGDSVSADITGGKNFGIDTCWFDKFGTGKKVDATFCITKLEQLKKIL